MQICEDTPVQLESEVPGAPDRPSSVLVPRLLRLFESPHEDAKCLAVSIMNLLAGGMPHALSANLDRCAPPTDPSMAAQDMPTGACEGMCLMIRSS